MSGLRFAVVGGGLAGLAAAEELAAQGHQAELFEAGDRLGGRVGVARLDGREACLGGKNIGRRYTALRALADRDRERRWEFFGPETMQVTRRGRLMPMSFSRVPARMRMGARLALRGELAGLRRFIALTSRVKRDEDAGFLGDEGFAEIASEAGEPRLPDHFGRVFADTVIRHTTVRMNGAEPDEITLGTFGSNLGLVVDRFDQLTDGLGPVIADVAKRHRVHLHARVDSVLVHDGRASGVRLEGGEEHAGFDGVVVAAPARAAARMLAPADARLGALLRTIRYHPVAVVVAAYDRPVFPERFAAIATPPGLVLSNAGSYGLDDRHIVRFTFSGRAARGRIEPATFEPLALLEEAERYLARWLPIGEAVRKDFIAQAFDPGLCAYRPDHIGFRREAAERLKAVPGLALAGDYMRGASLEACTRSGIDAAGVLLGGDARRRARSAAAV